MMRRALRRWLPLLLLLTFFGAALTQVVGASITFDEGPHLAVGYATLRTGDYRLQPVHIHPPLANILAAAPLLVQADLRDPTTIEGWEIASLSAVTDEVIWQYPHPRRIATAARVPMLLLGVLLGAVLYRWAQEAGGSLAGLMALALYAFDPNFIAHSGLVTTDVPATLFIVVTLYAIFRFTTPTAADHARARWIGIAGVVLGLAQLTKVSAALLVPVVGLVLLIPALRERGSVRRTLMQAFVQFAGILAIAACVVWAGYRFSVTPVPGWPFPLPAGTHIRIYQSLREHYKLGHPTFALGKVSTGGWWWYFPLAFVLKTPLPTLLLLGLSAILQISAWIGSWMPDRDRLARILSFGLFPTAYLIASLFSTVNIGYRHLLPVLPPAYAVVSLVWMRRRHRLPRAGISSIVLGLLLAWLVVGTVRVLPYPLSFFNALASGPSNGYRYLVDSNLDWGQNLWDLKRWLNERGAPHVYYAHYSPARPQAYGIDADYLPPDPRALDLDPWNPTPGIYAIGATVLQGPYAPDINTYAWFREREPVVKLGNALFVYEVVEKSKLAWLGLCPGATSLAYAERQLGLTGLRVLQPTCEQAFAYPDPGSAGGPDEVGLYVLPPGVEADEMWDPWLQLRDANGGTTARVFRASGTDSVEASITTPLVVEFDGPVTFLGYGPPDASTQEDGLEIRTYWRVEEIPDRALSLMAHLVTADGTVVAVGDGLGYPLDQWSSGDVIVQRHALEIQEPLPAGATLTIQIGGYWLDTMERWSTNEGQKSVPILEVRAADL
ncbi:MAG: ArnT family glycosyltransferase [Anaerolineae bacterium]